MGGLHRPLTGNWKTSAAAMASIAAAPCRSIAAVSDSRQPAWRPGTWLAAAGADPAAAGFDDAERTRRERIRAIASTAAMKRIGMTVAL